MDRVIVLSGRSGSKGAFDNQLALNHHRQSLLATCNICVETFYSMDNLSLLPSEIIFRIIRFLNPLELINCRWLSRRFYQLSKDPHLWDGWSPGRLAEEFNPPPTIRPNHLGSQNVELIAARCYILTHRIHPSPKDSRIKIDLPQNHSGMLRGYQFKDLQKLWFIPGGQFLVAQFQPGLTNNWIEVWSIPLLLEADSRPRLIGTTQRILGRLDDISCSIKSSESMDILTINVLIWNGIERFHVALEPNTLENEAAPISKFGVPGNSRMDRVHSCTLDRFFWWNVPISWTVEERDPVVIGIFETQTNESHFVRLGRWGTHAHEVAKIIDKTLVVIYHHYASNWPIARILLYSLPVLHASPSSVAYEDIDKLSDESLSLPVVNHIALEIQRGDKVLWVETFGSNIIGLGITRTSDDYSMMNLQLFKIIPVPPDDPLSKGPQLAYLGQVHFPKPTTMDIYDHDWTGRSAMLVDQPSGCHLRLMWLNDNGFAFLCIIVLDDEHLVVGEAKVETIKLNTLPEAEILAATDCFSGRCATIVEDSEHEYPVGVNIFEGMGVKTSTMYFE
ncbi:hypothetical protein DL96DRAFT_1679224 [Flagelloscypha sp. PMI_526]|nr:hypothetical protein DL96DRAFT_1679224 [Flagelloscypha sp. PMI_526]